MIEAGELERDGAQHKVAGALDQLARNLANHGPVSSKWSLRRLFAGPRRTDAPRGLYIHGDVGRGKSMLMDLFFETVPFEPKARVHFHEFMEEVHDAIHRWRQQRKVGKADGDDPIVPVADRIARDALLLCFDEFHVQDIADAMILGRLFTRLFNLGVIVVATSNRPPDTLYENGLNRALFVPFIDLLNQRVQVISLDGDIDYRLNRMAGLDTYYVPADGDADRSMQRVWRKLTDVERGERAVLTLKGRELEVPQAAKGVARFDFGDLCEQPLGASDFLKIAHNFHTVLIEHIPQFERDMKNQAKRFVTLIDAFYENKVKLIASAAVEPEALYRRGDHAFEFKRTSSRLREMQSEAYLALGHGL